MLSLFWWVLIRIWNTYIAASTLIASVGITATGRSSGSILKLVTATLGLGLDWSLQSGWDDLGGQVQVLSQVVDALVGEVPVKVAPGELLLDEALRLERLKSADDVQVGDLAQSGVVSLWVVVLLGDHDALLEEVLKDGQSVLVGHKHVGAGWSKTQR